MFLEFHPYQERYGSYLQTYHIQGKRCSWPYRVIPTKAMAQMGFEFTPKFKGKALVRDCVRCSFCGTDSYDFHDCRSKPLTATLTKVLENHLLRTQDSCLYTRLKFVLIRSFWKNEVIDWSEQQTLGMPHSAEIMRLRQWTFKEGWIHESEPPISSAAMAEAGLYRYDLGLSSPELQEEHPDATYCIYCSKIIGSWEADDDPLWEHFVCSNGGQCLFFETMSNRAAVVQMKRRYDEEGYGSNDKLMPSLDYYETFGSQLLKYEQEATADESEHKRGRPRSRGSGETVTREVKKRGRPRKEKPAEQLALEEGTTSLDFDGTPMVKRKRGRPRKAANSVSTEMKQKRPRGRPRKETTSSGMGDHVPTSMSPPSTGSLKLLASDGTVLANTSSAGDVNSLPPLNLPTTGVSALIGEPDVKGGLQQVQQPSAAMEIDNSPKRRIRLRQNQRLTSTEDQEIDSDDNSTKSIVFNFNNSSPKSKAEARNPIIDDSFDAFSFSAHGNSEFVIPESAFQTKKTSILQPLAEKSFGVATLQHSDDEYTKESSLCPKPTSKDNALDDIDMNVEMSDDSSESFPLSKASTPIGSPARSLSPRGKPVVEARPDTQVDKTERNSISSARIGSNIDEDNSSPIAGKIDNLKSFPSGGNVGSHESEPVLETAGYPSRVEERVNMSFPTPAPNLLTIGNESARPLSANSAVTTRENSKRGSLTSRLPEDTSSQQGTPTRDKFSVDSGSVNVSSSAAELRNSFNKVDEERALLADYFRQLLRYINVKDLSLSSEVDGDLNFFVLHMPLREKQLTFTAWVDTKQSELNKEFERDYKIKVAKLKKQFELAKRLIENIDNDETLLRLAKHYGALDQANRAH
ncbi:survivin LALA0_S12e01992g [Lachancea lanzarotensis]|uniref:LALA0S12e01992g1_1 n=1 Tax=Lachancea lanzarotensis TaxID=1245769 RepID=A0A0C7NFW6_9SACH|nr:uncharacterized protein LALA0_S12e01992g [Lachancea lanzarotensis]CEP64571.1 LALA0S12e01992g1_1 [Lachancea lanzarotensis]